MLSEEAGNELALVWYIDELVDAVAAPGLVLAEPEGEQ